VSVTRQATAVHVPGLLVAGLAAGVLPSVVAHDRCHWRWQCAALLQCDVSLTRLGGEKETERKKQTQRGQKKKNTLLEKATKKE
jgi:hypothetical protein